jgi:putative nucleotidyltransferase with HDIG domain
MSLSSSWIEKIQSLPVLPQVAMRVAERMQSPTATTEEIAKLIRSDAGLTAKLLRLANSSYYSIPGGVSDVNKALQFLGFNTVAQLVLTSSIFGSFRSQGTREFPLSSFWTHSFAVGLLSEITARSLQLQNASDCFIGGLMHDIGKLIMMELSSDQLSKISIHAREHQEGFIETEQNLQLPTHVELGTALARFWNLPNSVFEAIESHHQTVHKSTEAAIVAWSNQWVHSKSIGHSGNYKPAEEINGDVSIGTLKLSEKHKSQIESTFLKEFEKAEAILNGN